MQKLSFFLGEFKAQNRSEIHLPHPTLNLPTTEKSTMLQRRHQKLELLYKLRGAQKTKMLVYKIEINCQSGVMVHNSSLSEPHQKALQQLLHRFLMNSPQAQWLKTWLTQSSSTVSTGAHQNGRYSWLCVNPCSIRNSDNINYINNNITIHFIRKQKQKKG